MPIKFRNHIFSPGRLITVQLQCYIGWVCWTILCSGSGNCSFVRVRNAVKLSIKHHSHSMTDNSTTTLLFLHQPQWLDRGHYRHKIRVTVLVCWSRDTKVSLSWSRFSKIISKNVAECSFHAISWTAFEKFSYFGYWLILEIKYRYRVLCLFVKYEQLCTTIQWRKFLLIRSDKTIREICQGKIVKWCS